MPCRIRVGSGERRPLELGSRYMSFGPPGPYFLHFARFVQAVLGVLTNRLEKPVTRLCRVVIVGDYRAANQTRELIQYQARSPASGCGRPGGRWLGAATLVGTILTAAPGIGLANNEGLAMVAIVTVGLAGVGVVLLVLPALREGLAS